MRSRADPLRRWLRVLRARVPPRLPVIVRRAKLPAVWGDMGVSFSADGRPRAITIRLARELTDAGLYFVLAHEWAHALEWPRDGDRDHDRTWGASYARVYRALEEGLEPDVSRSKPSTS